MRTDYFINSEDFKEIFPKFEINDFSIEDGIMPPLEWRIDRGLSNVEGLKTLDMVLYLYFLDNTGVCPQDTSDVHSEEIATFMRVEVPFLAWMMNCGNSALKASIDRLKEKKLLFVLHEVGKANAYLARV